MTALSVALGGALGALARWGVSERLDTLEGAWLPWGTLTVNVLGSFLLGAVIVWLYDSTQAGDLRYLVAVGFLGSFTTFSSYSQQTLALLGDGAWGRAAVYALGSVVLAVAGAAAGVAFARAA